MLKCRANVVRVSRLAVILSGVAVLWVFTSFSSTRAADEKWVASWAAAQHGPYPSGNATPPIDLRFAFPDAAAGANDQTLRLIVKPDLWGNRVRVRFSNAYGDKPLQLDQV